ncbi:MAG TPA: prepilin-type N-terminal cleavage/methylation domain-containing protein [Longimicrobiales bacterium]|nr:prepilin-type N-terminal cleavage/methylation domain-containing protein [Longimicrobiales bacterium]
MTGPARRRRVRPVPRGFTIVEIVVVLVIMGVMALVALPSVGDVVTNRRAQNARNDLIYVASRAQMSAVARGEMVRLSMNPTTDVLTTITASGDTLEVFDLADRDAADLLIPSGTLHMCYSPLGFAHPACSDVTTTSVPVGVAVGGRTVWASMSATGVVKP